MNAPKPTAAPKPAAMRLAELLGRALARELVEKARKEREARRP